MCEPFKSFEKSVFLCRALRGVSYPPRWQGALHTISQLEADVDSFLSTLAERDRDSLATCKTYIANARLMETDKASDYAGNLLSVIMSSR